MKRGKEKMESKKKRRRRRRKREKKRKKRKLKKEKERKRRRSERQNNQKQNDESTQAYTVEGDEEQMEVEHCRLTRNTTGMTASLLPGGGGGLQTLLSVII